MCLAVETNIPTGEDTLKLLHACSEEMKRFILLKDKRQLAGFTMNQLDIMYYVGKSREGVMLGDIIRHFRMSRSSATQTVARLVRCGYLEKRISDGDRRILVISPTDKLRGLNASVFAIEKKYIVPIFDGLPEEDKAAMYKVLNKIYGELSERLS